MTIADTIELDNSREKLTLLEQRCKLLESQSERTHSAELSLRSLKQILNQLREEVARYESFGLSVERKS